MPFYRAMDEFMEENLRGKNFQTIQEIQAVLNTWPTFAEEKGVMLDKVFRAFEIQEDLIRSVKEGMGGPLVIAFLEQVD